LPAISYWCIFWYLLSVDAFCGEIKTSCKKLSPHESQRENYKNYTGSNRKIILANTLPTFFFGNSVALVIFDNYVFGGKFKINFPVRLRDNEG